MTTSYVKITTNAYKTLTGAMTGIDFMEGRSTRAVTDTEKLNLYSIASIEVIDVLPPNPSDVVESVVPPDQFVNLTAPEPIRKEVRDLEPSAIVELFKLTFVVDEAIPDTLKTLYFHAGTNEIGGSVKWGGIEYKPLPIKADGFSMSTSGVLPRPKLKLANPDGVFSAYLMDSNDLVGCKVTRIRTFVRYLDSSNFADGNSEANFNISFPPDVWFVEQKISENRYAIEWELVSVFDLNGITIPRRVMLQNSCPYLYMGDMGCSWTRASGISYDVHDIPTELPSNDICGKRLSSCKVRFGAKEILPFGGFPGIVKNE